MNPICFKKMAYLVFILLFGFLGTRCATQNGEVHETSMGTYPKDYVYPLSEINLEKVFSENRGLKVLEENATMVHDYYRGGVQEKEEGEGLLKEGKWEEARVHLEKSNRFLKVVMKYLPDDQAHRNIYDDQAVIFLPNLLIADNDLKLMSAYKHLGSDDKVAVLKEDGEYYLAESLKTVKTEWANQIKNSLTLPPRGLCRNVILRR
jgi:hypothetical protein